MEAFGPSAQLIPTVKYEKGCLALASSEQQNKVHFTEQDHLG